MPAVDVCCNLSVAVAGYVLQSCRYGRTLLKACNRHDGKKLVQAPSIGQRLEKGEVAIVLVGHALVDVAKLVRHMLHVVGELANFVSNTPVQALYLCTSLQVEKPHTEEVEGFFADILGIVPVLEHGTLVNLVPNLRQVAYELVVLGLGFEVFRHHRRAYAFQDVED